MCRFDITRKWCFAHGRISLMTYKRSFYSITIATNHLPHIECAADLDCEESSKTHLWRPIDRQLRIGLSVQRAAVHSFNQSVETNRLFIPFSFPCWHYRFLSSAVFWNVRDPPCSVRSLLHGTMFAPPPLFFSQLWFEEELYIHTRPAEYQQATFPPSRWSGFSSNA